MTLPAPLPAFHWSGEPWGAALRCSPLLGAAQHAFTSKQLQLPADEAWRDAAASVGARPDRVMRVKQVHGNRVRILRRGDVAAEAHQDRPEADALASNEPGLALAVVVADCVPILIVDPVAGAAAAVHAGWRGTCARVAAAAVQTMHSDLGCEPRHLVAAIGPSAGPDDYEVGAPLIDAFRDAGHPTEDIDRWFDRKRPKPHLDLWSANRDQLARAGIPGDHIYICGLSTVSHPDVFTSYRVAGERAGRMAGLVVVPAAQL
jgi:YfiH family protein